MLRVTSKAVNTSDAVFRSVCEADWVMFARQGIGSNHALRPLGFANIPTWVEPPRKPSEGGCLPAVSALPYV